MEDKIFFIWLGISLITHCLRTVYEILKTYKKMKPGKILFTLMFINMIFLWVSWICMCETDVVRVPFPDMIRYGGLAIFLGGVVIFFIGLSTIKALETHEGDLVTHGIYTKIRHPMYLGFILWLIGYSVYCGALLSLIVSAALIANILFWRYLEERELSVRYPAYDEYKKTTMF
jgi:protein-S-isoprenylcysteine O-methyltransferase Ste14